MIPISNRREQGPPDVGVDPNRDHRVSSRVERIIPQTDRPPELHSARKDSASIEG